MGWFDDAVKSFNPLSAVGDIIGAGGNIIGAKMSADTAQWNTRKQLEWEREKFAKETELANTEVQRRVKDLEAAGLNKILATGQGASVPTAGSINPSMPDYSGIGRAAEMLGHGINTALDIDLKRKTAEAEIDKINAQTASIKSDMNPGAIKDQAIAESKKRQALLETEENLNREKIKTEKTIQELNKKYSKEAITRALKNQQEIVTEAVNTQIKQFELDTSPWRATIGAIKNSVKAIVSTVCLPLTLKGLMTHKIATGITKKVLKENVINPNDRHTIIYDKKTGEIINEYYR